VSNKNTSVDILTWVSNNTTMYNKGKKPYFTKRFQFWGIIFILGISISITTIDIFGSLQVFKIHSQNMRTGYISTQKQLIKQEVMRVVNLISREREESKEETKNLIQSRVNEAVEIARNIYEQNKTTWDHKAIHGIIIDALRPIRFNDGNGYFLITSFDGTRNLVPDRPELEGKNVLKIQDINGQDIVKDMIEIAKSNPEGEYYQYHWTKPGEKEQNFKKIAFVRRLENFDCLVSAGLYVDDIKESLKDRLLTGISNIRFGKEGYIFINTLSGDVLVGNGKRFANSRKLWEIKGQSPEKLKLLFAKESAAASTANGEFIQYSFEKLNNSQTQSPKISFIYGIPDFQWIIGAGVYLDNIESEIATMQTSLAKQIKTRILYSSLLTLIIFAFLLPLFRKSNKQLNQDIDILITFFNKLISSDKPIDRNQIEFHEFDQMAKNINLMFLDKKLAQLRLKDEKEALLQSESKYRNTMDSALIGVYIIQDLTFQYVNPAMAAMFGYTPGEMEGKMSPLDLVAPKDYKRVKENLILQAIGDLQNTYDIKCIRKNGEMFDAMALGSASMHNGKPASVGTMIDITDRKTAEKELKKSETRATALLEAIPDMVFLMNDKGQYLDIKADPNDLYVQEREKIIGKTSHDLLPKPLADLIKKSLHETLNTGAMITFEYQLMFSEDTFFDYEARMVKSGKNEVTSIVRNITERKKNITEKEHLEKQLNRAKRMESIGLMAGGVAHDLNNILSGIIGYPELILQKIPEESDLHRQISAIRDSGIQAAAVVDDLLTVARGAASIRENCSLESLILDYLQSLECSKLKSLYPNINIEYQFDAPQNIISCSQVHVKKCLMNLVTNSVESISTEGTVHISTRNHLQHMSDEDEESLRAGEYIILGIRDDGPGIARENIEHIFEPFYSKKVMAKSGTGLGLTVVWNTVQDHNGKITVDSSDQGTIFQLYFPVLPDKSLPAYTREPNDKSAGQGEHILIVDDEPLLRDIACRMLETLGYQVDAVASGEEAIAFVRETRVDLLIIDMLMEPGINGYQTYKKILSLHPGQKAIIASGFSENKVVKATLSLGAESFIKKPYSMTQLSQAIQITLNG